MSKWPRRVPLGPVLLGMAVAVMVGLLFYALLATEPDVAYIVGVLAAAGVTGWAALECLFCDWAGRGGGGHLRRRLPPSPPGPPDGLGRERREEDGSAHAPVQPVRFRGADSTDRSGQESAPSFFRRPPTR